MKRRVAIQGILGSFHHQVAINYFGTDIEIVECLSFSEMPSLLIDGKVDDIVMAIENSIAGAILSNYALIDEYQLEIEGEVYLPIHHHLMALPGQKIADIKEVRSHPMAILQCEKFFRDYPHIKLVSAVDTAFVSKQIKEYELRGVGAIASKIAGEIYDLDVLSNEIQTRKNNLTRFFILNKELDKKNDPQSVNKASLKLITEHQIGSLGEILKVFSDHQINLTKIQSVPIIDEPWQYSFFIDVVFDDYVVYQKVMRIIKTMVKQLKILGVYSKSKSNYISNS